MNGFEVALTAAFFYAVLLGAVFLGARAAFRKVMLEWRFPKIVIMSDRQFEKTVDDLPPALGRKAEGRRYEDEQDDLRTLAHIRASRKRKGGAR